MAIEQSPPNEFERLEQALRELRQLFELTRQLAKAEVETRPEGGDLVSELVRVHLYKIAAHLHSILRILDKCCEAPIIWDLSGVAALSRSIVDAALGVSYWRDKSNPNEEGAKFRLNLLHENYREAQMLKAIGSEAFDEISLNEEFAGDAGKGIESDPIFQGRYADRLKKALKGNLPRLLDNEEIAERAGLNLVQYDTTWRLLSMHSHAHPHAITTLRTFRARDGDAARQVQTFVRVAMMYASWAALDFESHFPAAGKAFTAADRRNAQIHTGMLMQDFPQAERS